MAAEDKSQQIFDVAKPGKTAAAASARPVIVNHGPMLKDPMVSEKTPEPSVAKTEVSTAPAAKGSRKVITPPNEPQPKTQDFSGDSKGTDSGSVTEKTDSAQQQAGPNPGAQQNSSETATADSGDIEPRNDQSSAAIVDAVIDQTAAKKKNEPTKEEVARLAELGKLVESKQYFIKLKPSTHKKRTFWATAIVVALLIITMAYLAVDAEVIDIGLELPYEIIR